MDLDYDDIMTLFALKEKELDRLIDTAAIPHYRISGRIMFNSSEIKTWSVKNNVPANGMVLSLDLPGGPVSLSSLIERGGATGDVRGKNAADALANGIKLVNRPSEIGENLIMDSYGLAKGIGKDRIVSGILLPHYRRPLLTEKENEKICFLYFADELPVDKTLAAPAHSLVLIFSAKPQRHIDMLIRLRYICGLKDFSALAASMAPVGRLLEPVIREESLWRKK